MNLYLFLSILKNYLIKNLYYKNININKNLIKFFYNIHNIIIYKLYLKDFIWLCLVKIILLTILFII